LFACLRQCDSGFSCAKVAESFSAIQGDFETPWNSIITILSFLTLRGWPNIFWAIQDAKGPYIALLTLILIPSLTFLLVLNLFPSVFVVAMKRGEERVVKRELLQLYPGDVNQVTELELLAWANRNRREIIVRKRKDAKKKTDEVIKMLPWLEAVDEKGNSIRRKKQLEAAKLNDLNLNQSSNGKADPTTAAAPGTASGPTIVVEETLRYDSDDEEHKPEEFDYDTTILVPNCYGCESLRNIFANDGSRYSMLIMFIVVINIFMLSLDSDNPSRNIEAAIYYSNFTFNCIYGLDVVLKLLVLGPIRFICSPMNDLDLALTLIGLLGVGGFNLPRYLNNFRILRLLRLLRYYRLRSFGSSEYSKKNRDPSITFEKLAFMLSDILLPLLNVSVILLLFMYMWSILGMNLFAEFSYANNNQDAILSYNLTAIRLDHDNGNLLAEADLKYRWWGSKLTRMSFDNFPTTFVTIFNLLAYNSWYEVMINTLHISGSNNSPWYFITWLVVSNLIVISTLSASIAAFMERFAQDNVSANAKAAKHMVIRMRKIREKSIKRHYFAKLKKYTIDDNEYNPNNVLGDRGGRQKTVAVIEAEEKRPLDPWYVRFVKERHSYSFYLLSPQNPLRRLIKWMVGSLWFQSIVAFAIILSVISIITDDSTEVMSKSQWDFTNFIVPFVFFAEMGLEWVSDCIYGTPTCYFSHPVNWMDFAVNVVLAVNYGITENFSNVRIARLLKLPQVLILISRSDSFKLILQSLREAYKSLFLVTCMLLGFIAFFGVVGLQIWLGQFTSCSYADFPPGRNRFKSDAEFPYGCNGTAYVPIYGLNTSELISLQWNTELDNFNDIFKACKSVFKIMLFNNWATIMYDAFDITSTDRQPIANHSRAAFLFFMVVIVFAFMISVLYLAVIYYHFIITLMTSGSGLIVGENAALWSAFQKRLGFVEKQKFHISSTHITGFKKYLNLFFKQSNMYRVVIILYTLGPVVLVSSYRSSTYTEDYFISVEFGLACAYLIEYLFRVYADNFQFYQTLASKIELLVIAFECLQIAAIVALYAGQHVRATALLIIYIGIFVRCYRLFTAFPHMHIFVRSMVRASNSFIPCLFNLIFVILIYGKIAHISFKQHNFNFNNDFLEYHYNFHDTYRSCITMVAMATGNMWTEIVSDLKDNAALGWQFYVEILFTSYYLIIYFLLKTFTIILISKYSIYAGGTIGLANQQIRQFRMAWLKLKNPDSIDLVGLLKLLQILKPPLGCGKQKDFLSVIRYAKSVLVCMPESASINALPMFDVNTLPDDIRVMMKDKKPLKFNFHMVLTALHKKCMLGAYLPDEAQYHARRELHKERLGLLKLRIGRLTTNKHAFTDSRKAAFHVSACRNQLILQRLDSKRYRAMYLKIMSEHLATARKSIQSFGYRGFDTLFISILTRAARNQHRAALSQLKLRKILNPQFLQNPTAIAQYEVAKAYELNVRYVFEAAKDLAERYVGKHWSVNDMVQLAKFQEKGTVSAMAVDSFNTIFSGFSNGTLKIWRNTGGQGDLSHDSKYKLAQTLEFDGVWIRSMTVSADGLSLFVGVGSETVMLTTKGGRRRKLHYTEIRRFKEHNGNVNGIVLYGRYLATASDDGYVYLYALATGQPVNSYYVGASIFCISAANVLNSEDSTDDAFLTDILACGSANGYLTALPLPLLSENSNDTQSMEAISIFGGNCAISAIRSCWKFLYAGFIDGTVKVFAIVTNKEYGSARYPIRMISLIRVSNMAIHAGPVTSMAATGGHFFTASHDFSVVPWIEPDKLDAKSENEFTQSQGTSYVVHTHAIVCMAANKNMIVSGDDCGQIVVMAPKLYKDQYPSQAVDNSNTNLVLFSFLDYDFKFGFLPTNGCVSEEETYLSIKNTSDSLITVRCLSMKTNGFRVEMNPIVNEKNGTTVRKLTTNTGNRYDLLEFGPNHAAVYRIVFSPEDAYGYNELIEFLVNESFVVRVSVRGIGVKNQVFILGGKTHYEFESVYVGESVVETLTLVNPSAKTVAVSLYDEPTRINDQDEKINLMKQNIRIHPKSFVMKENQSVTVSIIYSPDTPMTSFELPLKFAISGAVCTLATIRARSQIAYHEIRPDRKKSFTNSMLNSSEIVATGLRALDYSEALCPGDLTNLLLNANGYRVFVDKHAAFLYHTNTGMFLEFVHRVDDSKHWHYHPHVDTLRLTFRCQHEQPFQETSESTVDALRGMISQMTTKSLSGPMLSDYINIEPTATKVGNLREFEEELNHFYEIWHGDRLLTYGNAESGKTIEVLIKSSDLYIYSENRKIESCGYQTIELLIFSMGERPRQSSGKYTPKAVAPDYTSNGKKYGSLRSVTYVKVAQGFRMIRAKETGDVITPFPKLEIVGIEEVITFLPGGLGSVTEVFGQGEDKDEAGNAEIGSPVFAPVSISLRSTDAASQYKITDNVSSLERDHHQNKVIKQQTVMKSDTFKSTTSIENINLYRPQTKGMNVTEDNCVRRIDIELSRKEAITDTGASQLKLLRKCSIYTHTVQQLMNRSQALAIDASSMLPHEIRSYPLCVAVDIVQPKGESLTRMVSSNMVMDLLSHGRETRSKNLTNLFDGQWFFVVDRSRLKLVNADPDVSTYSDVYQLSAVDITFLPHGCFMIMEDASGMLIEDSQVIRSNKQDSLPKIKKEIIRSNNFTGNPSPALQIPSFLSNIWRIMQKDAMLNSFRKGMLNLLIKRQQRLRYEAEIQVNAMKKALDDKERVAMALRKNQSLTTKEYEERRQVEKKMAEIIDAIPTAKTYKEVYEEMVRISTEHAQKINPATILAGVLPTNESTKAAAIVNNTIRNKKLHLDLFSQYMQQVAMPGLEKPYTAEQAEILLRDLLMDDEHYVPLEAFKEWYLQAEGQKLYEQLNEKNVFAMLLDHELKRLEGEADSFGVALDEPKRLEKPGDSIILKYRLNTGWENRDTRPERAMIEKLITQAFLFSYKGGMIQRGTVQAINYKEGVEFKFTDPNLPASPASKTHVIPAQTKKSWLKNMFGIKSTKAEDAAGQQIGIELMETSDERKLELLPNLSSPMMANDELIVALGDAMLGSESKDEKDQPGSTRRGLFTYKSVGTIIGDEGGDGDDNSSNYNESILDDNEDIVPPPLAADYDSDEEYEDEVEEEETTDAT
jgi:WD40 repeat protein